MVNINNLIKNEIKSECKNFSLRNHIRRPNTGTYNSDHTGYTRFKNIFESNRASIKNVLSKLRSNEYKNLKSVLSRSIYRDSKLFKHFDEALIHKDEINDNVIHSFEVDDELEYKILEREGYNKLFLSNVARIIQILKDDGYKTNNIVERELKDYYKSSSKFEIGPLYISLIIKCISKCKNINSFDELLVEFINFYKNDTLSNVIKSQGSSTGGKHISKPISVDKQLEDEVSNLLLGISKRNIEEFDRNIGRMSNGEENVCNNNSFNDSYASPSINLEDELEIINVKPNGNDDDSRFISTLSCEILSKEMKCDVEKMREICREIECNESNLTLEETEFIMDEMGLKDFCIKSINGKMVLLKSQVEMVKRPLVITIMGHVDHGKTTLLDRIQKSEIVKTEVGNITQKLGTFQVLMDNVQLTFVDTPGHSAFSVMRCRGITCADLVLLVIAADDGIMPQTLESIKLIKETSTPCIVVINKIDLVTEELLYTLEDSIKNYLLDAPIVYISARSGTNINSLLNKIYEMDNVLNIQTDLKGKGMAYIYETIQHPTRGKCLNVIVRNGTLKEGSWITCGINYGKIKKMHNSSGINIKVAQPSQIAQIVWLQDITNAAGQFIHEAKNQNHAIKVANINKKKLEVQRSSEVSSLMDIPQINVVLRCGDQGGLEAVMEWIDNFNKDKLKTVDLDYLIERGYINDRNDTFKLNDWKPINIVAKHIGPFNQSDSQSVNVGNVSFLGFNISSPTQEMYEFYYGPTYVMKKECTLQVTQLGTITIKGVGKRQVIGAAVKDGSCKIGHYFMISRDGKVITRDLTVYSMQSSKKNVTELTKGDNNAIIFKSDLDIKENDEIIAYTKNNLPPLFDKITQFNLKN